MANFYNRAVRLVQQVSNGSKQRPSNECKGLLVVEKQSVERVARQLTKITKLSANAQLELTPNPPCLQEILQQLDSSVLEIVQVYEQRYHILNECEYFRVFLSNLVNKLRMLKYLLLQFDYSKHSEHRKTLTRFTITLQHLLFELHGIFPSRMYSDSHVRALMTKEAASWWNRTFATRTIVPWGEFLEAFCAEHGLRANVTQATALQKTIDLTADGYVSVVELDTFVRLYQPWQNVLSNWSKLAVTHPGYLGYATYDELRVHLEQKGRQPGAYAYRMSCTKLGQWAIGYVSADFSVLQTILHDKSLAAALTEGNDKKMYRYPSGMPDNPDLAEPFDADCVSQAQYESYLSRFGCLGFCFCDKCGLFAKLSLQFPCFHQVCMACLGVLAKQSSASSSSLRCALCTGSPSLSRRQMPVTRAARPSRRDNRRSLAVGDDSPLLSSFEHRTSVDDLHVEPHMAASFDARTLLNDRNVIGEEDPFALSLFAAARQDGTTAVEHSHSNRNFEDDFVVARDVQNALSNTGRPSFVISQMMKDYFYSKPNTLDPLQPEPPIAAVGPLVSDCLLDQPIATVVSSDEQPLIDLDAKSPVVVAKQPDLFDPFLQSDPFQVQSAVECPSAAACDLLSVPFASDVTMPPELPPRGRAAKGSLSAAPATETRSASQFSTLDYLDSKIVGMLEKAKNTRLLPGPDAPSLLSSQSDNSALAQQDTKVSAPKTNEAAKSEPLARVPSRSHATAVRKEHDDEDDEDDDEEESFDALKQCAVLLTSEKRDLLVRLIPGLKLCRCSVSCYGFNLTSDSMRQIEEILLQVQRDPLFRQQT